MRSPVVAPPVGSIDSVGPEERRRAVSRDTASAFPTSALLQRAFLRAWEEESADVLARLAHLPEAERLAVVRFGLHLVERLTSDLDASAQALVRDDTGDMVAPDMAARVLARLFA